MVWSIEKEKLKQELCLLLTRIGALRFGIFPVINEKLSPYYVDLRIVQSFPEAFETIENVFARLAQNEVGTTKFDRIVGIPYSGIPYASVLAYLLHKPFLYTRKEAMNQGRTKRLEGILYPGDKVLLVDDLIMSGKTLLNASDAILAEGGVVEDALVLIDREEGGREALLDRKIHFNCLLTMSEVSLILYNKEIITKDQMSSILTQIKSSKK